MDNLRRRACGGIAVALLSTSAAGSALASEPSPSVNPGAFEVVGTYAVPDLGRETSMDIGPDGRLYVGVQTTDQILVINPDGTLERRIGEHGSGPGQFDFLRQNGDVIGGVAVASDGTVYVAESRNHRVQAFDPDGHVLRTWGTNGSGDGQFQDPIDVAVAPDGTVYVVDDYRDVIQAFTPEGQFLRKIGSHGFGDGQMNFTCGIDVMADGTVLNADCGNHRIEAWSPDGTFLWTMGSPGTGPGQFNYIGDVFADPSGLIFSGEPTRIQAFGPDRKVVASWDIPGTTEAVGANIAFDGHGTAWVAVGPTLLKLKVLVPGAAT